MTNTQIDPQAVEAVPRGLTHDDIAELDNITRKSRALLLVFVVIGIVLFVLLSLQAGQKFLAGADVDVLESERGPLNAAITAAGIAFAVPAQLVQIAVAFFAYRTNKNARKAGGQGLVFTPFWAAAVNFIPPAQILLPYFVTRETWIVSCALANQPKATRAVNLWGGAWILIFVALIGADLFQDVALPLAAAFATLAGVFLRRVMADLTAVQLQFPRAPDVPVN